MATMSRRAEGTLRSSCSRKDMFKLPLHFEMLWCDGRPVWSRTSDCQSGNPGSNPGRRIFQQFLYTHQVELFDLGISPFIYLFRFVRIWDFYPGWLRCPLFPHFAIRGMYATAAPAKRSTILYYPKKHAKQDYQYDDAKHD